MLKRNLGWIAGLALVIALAFTARALAESIGKADAAAAESARLDTIVRATQASAALLTEALGDIDAANALRAREDSIRIVELAGENTVLAAQFDSLVAADSVHAEGVEAALSDLMAQLDEEDLPPLRRLTGLYETRLMGFRSQVSTLVDQVRVVTEERDIARADADRERRGRAASDVLVVGLRTQITAQAATIDSRDVEIGNLRNAVVPGFFLRLKQEAELVALVATVSAGITLLLTR